MGLTQANQRRNLLLVRHAPPTAKSFLINFVSLSFVLNDLLALGSTGLEQENIAVFHDIIFALGHQLALGSDLGFVTELFKYAVVVHDGLDEGLLKVGVNDTGGLRRLGAIADGPLTDLIRADGEEAAQVEGLAHLDNKFRQRRLGTDILALCLNLSLGLEAGKAFFERDRDGDDRVTSSVILNPLGDSRKMLVLLADVVSLGQVDEVNNGLGREEEQRIDDLDLDRS